MQHHRSNPNSPTYSSTKRSIYQPLNLKTKNNKSKQKSDRGEYADHKLI